MSIDPGSTTGMVAPRVAIQPAVVSIEFGQQEVVRVVGLDIEGLMTEDLRLAYDPASLEIGETQVGPAVAFDPVYPPTITINPEKGEVVLRSTDPTKPLLFNSGGEILNFAIRATNPGEGYLVIDNLILRADDGRRVATTISGGRATVAYR